MSLFCFQFFVTLRLISKILDTVTKILPNLACYSLICHHSIYYSHSHCFRTVKHNFISLCFAHEALLFRLSTISYPSSGHSKFLLIPQDQVEILPLCEVFSSLTLSSIQFLYINMALFAYFYTVSPHCLQLCVYVPLYLL